ncbi:MAG TPA: hypothetical protein DD435_04375 [Cyanobacteria bacterium UBA8530]|nr:hypothetical protein [Cyanobacteria bacterium UBA8530]
MKRSRLAFLFFALFASGGCSLAPGKTSSLEIAQVAVRAPLMTPTQFRLQSTSVAEGPAKKAHVYLASDASVGGETDGDGNATIQVPSKYADQPLLLLAEIKLGDRTIILRTIARTGQTERFPLNSASTLLVASLDSQARTLGKTLESFSGNLDLPKMRQYMEKIHQRFQPQEGQIDEGLVRSLLDGDSAIDAMAQGAFLGLGMQVGDFAPAFAPPPPPPSFASDDFFPLVEGSKWTYSVRSSFVKGVLTQTRTSATSAHLVFDYDLGGVPTSQALDLSMLKQDGAVAMTGGNTLGNLRIPGIEGIVRCTGLEEHQTWTAYGSVQATVTDRFPEFSVRGKNYPHVVRILYSGKDVQYEEFRAKDVGLIKLNRADFTSLELVDYSKP